jgi:hypothetical protein
MFFDPDGKKEFFLIREILMITDQRALRKKED